MAVTATVPVIFLVVASSLISGVFSSTCSSQGTHLQATDEWQDLTSPSVDFPDSVSSRDCLWTIVTQNRSKNVLIETREFRLSDQNCTSEFVEISDVSGLRGKYCGSSKPTVRSKGGSLDIRYRTHPSNTDGMFHFRYTQVTGNSAEAYSTIIETCSDSGVTIDAGSTERYIESVNYPFLHPGNQDCKWVLHSTTDHYVVEVTVHIWPSVDHSLNCDLDYLAAYDGTSTVGSPLKKWCEPLGSTVHSSLAYLTLRFHTGNTQFGRIFQLSFREIPGSGRIVGVREETFIVLMTGIAFVAIIFICCFCCFCWRRRSRKQSPPPATPMTVVYTGHPTSSTLGSGTANPGTTDVEANREDLNTSPSRSTADPVSIPDMEAFAPPPYPGFTELHPEESPIHPAGCMDTPPVDPTEGTEPPHPIQCEPPLPDEPPPPYWLASKYVISPEGKVDTSQSVEAGQGDATDSGTENTSGTAEENASGVNNASFVPDEN